MALATLLALLAVAGNLASAHFSIEYPIWRSDSLTNKSYSQWTYPCANVPTNLPKANRTDWPLTGGSLVLDLHHPWTYIFVNLGLGSNASNFNYTLTPQFLNETGNGTLCLPRLELPAEAGDVADGTEASIQVVTLGESGNALYNCADITFRANATTLGDDACLTSEGVSFVTVGEANRSNASNGSTDGDTAAGGEGGSGSGSSGAGAAVASTAILSSVVGLVIVLGFM